MAIQEVNASDARDLIAPLGEIIGAGDARDDGGWDFVVEIDECEHLVSVVADADGTLSYLVL